MRIVDRETLNVVYVGEYDFPFILLALNKEWSRAGRAIMLACETMPFLDAMDFYDYEVTPE
mgnify:FL=1